MPISFIPRALSAVAEHLLKKYPLLTVMGPRQSGKSTFAKMIAPDFDYVNLEDIDHRRFALNDPKGFLERYPRKAILDEVQNVPQLLSQLQVHTDAVGKAGQYILTGSQNFGMYEKITQSLAGRTALCTLLPFSMEELALSKLPKSWEELCWKGMYPRLHQKKIKPHLFYPDYVTTYIERDTRQLMNVRDLSLFRRFMSLCAGRTGQLLNLSELGNNLGVDNKTVRQWLTVLESSYVVFLLPPYHENFNKRTLKSPKLYFYDTGIAAHLLNIRSTADMRNHFARGALYENFVIAELMKKSFNKRVDPKFYFFRDSNGNEVDLLIPKSKGFIAIEIKSGKTVNESFFKGLHFFKGLDGVEAKCICVYGGEELYSYKGMDVVGWNGLQNIPMP